MSQWKFSSPFLQKVSVALRGAPAEHLALASREATQFCHRGSFGVLVPQLERTALTKGFAEYKRAAVLIPLCHQFGIPSVLFTLRSNHVGKHKQQVSFPGGHVERGETASQAAVRETIEELGTSIAPITILQCWPNVLACSGIVVTPVLGFVQDDVGDLSQLQPNPAEVSQVFCLSVDHLRDRRHRQRIDDNTNKITRDTSLRILTSCFVGGPEPIWGVTGSILEVLVDDILDPLL